MLEHIQNELQTLDLSYSLCVTGDHTTPCVLGDHTYQPVPVTIGTFLSKSKLKTNKDFPWVDEVQRFNEIDCA